MLCNVNWVFKCTNLHACDAFCYEIFNSKKKMKLKFFFLKKKPKSVQTDRFRFSFLEQKPVQTGLAQFFQFNLVLAWFFLVWLDFFDLAQFDSVFF